MQNQELMKNAYLKCLFQEQVSKFKHVGKISYKYFLIEILIQDLNIQYQNQSQPFWPTKMVVSAQ
ncbi:unnamed protein product [Paramecium primaurelia]|uniref:Uncharacterized protein n=1 Tax=Paramecium primaurelia TaxID=5886 RepID=A0A8S1PUK0_PARPR|nr:unnamed protein product [Paramecium primaurelia]